MFTLVDSISKETTVDLISNFPKKRYFYTTTSLAY